MQILSYIGSAVVAVGAATVVAVVCGRLSITVTLFGKSFVIGK